MEFIAAWLVPVAVGGTIGLFTNWLAIKMLFRPLREIRLLGIRVPFTPGILPREKARLALSVGDTVAKELLTPETLRSRLDDPVLRARLEAVIGAALEGLASRDAGEVMGSASVESLRRDLVASTFSDSLKSLASGEAFRHALGAALAEASRRAFDVKLGDILPPEAARALGEKIAEGAGAEGTARFAASMVDSLYDSPAGGSAGGFGRAPSLIPASAVEPILGLVSRSLYTAAVPLLEKILADPSLRKEMERRAVGLVRRAVGRLGPVQRLIVVAANYEQSIADTMPETIEDISSAISGLLRDPSMPERILASVKAGFASPSGGALSSLVSREALKETLAETLSRLSSNSAELARSAEYRAVLISGRRLGDLAPGVESLTADIAVRVSGRLSALLGGEGAAHPVFAGLAERFLGDFSASLRGTDLGTALGIGPDARRALAADLAGKAMGILVAQTERIVEAIDVKAMVVARIEALDMREVERIILSVVDRELYWITVLGGILGAVIGLIQAALFAL